MGQKATSISEQILKLKDRGMVFDCEEAKIKEHLLDIGYYRLGFYWKPFEIDENHNFQEGTKFSDVITLYYLDVDLRNILNKYLTRLEINFRTKLVYYVSNKYKNSPTWFADDSVVNKEFITNLNKIYNEKFKINNKIIKNHHKKYINHIYAPAWKTLEFFTFGTNLNLYRNLREEDIQKRISKAFEIENPEKFQNVIGAMLELRNACAHGDVLYDFNLPMGLPNFAVFGFVGSDRQSIFACYKVLNYLVQSISVNRQKQLESEINELLDNHKENGVIQRMIETKMKIIR
jgi:abortive infection bacteriophage resistance protein